MPVTKPSRPHPDDVYNYQERAAIMEFLGNLSHEEAEDKAWKLVFGPRCLKQECLQFSEATHTC